MANYQNDPYQRPLLSLADSKTLKVAEKLGTKQLDHNPAQQTDIEKAAAAREWAGGQGHTDALDLAESSLYRAGGNVLDALKGVSNAAFDTTFDDRESTGLSNQQAADFKAQVSPEYRAQFQADQAAVLENVAKDDYLGASLATMGVAGRTLADSAGVVPELIAGAGLTAAGAALAPGVGAVPGAALLGKRLKKGADTIESVADAYKNIKSRDAIDKIADGISGLAKAGAKGAAQTSVVNLDMVQQTRNEYKAANNGEEPSPERLAGATLVNAVTLSVNPAIIKNFYLPKLMKKGDRSVRQMFDEELKAMAASADRSFLNNAARRSIAAVGKIAKAAGAEGAQEYAQSWGEILSVNMKPEEAGGFWKAALAEFKDDKNINESITAAFLGAGAGGVLRGATAVPTAAGALTVDAAAATGKAIADKAETAVAKIDFAKLSEEKKQELKEEAHRSEVEFRALRAKDKKLVTELQAAKSIDDIKSEEIQQDIYDRAKGRDLNDPGTFAEFRRGLIKKYKGRTPALKAKQKVTAAAKVAKAYTGKVVEDVVDLVPEDLVKKAEALADEAVELGEAAVDAIKNIDTDTALGFAEVTMEYSKNKTKAGLKIVKAEALKQGPTQLRNVAKIWADKDPEFAAQLNTWADQGDARLKRTGLKKDRILSFEKVSTSLKDVAQRGMKDRQPIAVANLLMDELKSRPGDAETVETLTKALDAYESSDFHQNKEEGHLTPARMKNARAKLAKFKEVHSTPVRDTIEGISMNLINQGVDLAKKAPKAPGAAIKWVKSVKLTRNATKETYRVKVSEAGDQFLGGLKEATKQIKAMPDTEQKAAVEALAVRLVGKDLVNGMQNMFDTKDPAVLAEILKAYIPSLPPVKDLMAKIAESVETPSSQITEDVTVTKGAKVVPSGEITMNEVGEFIVDVTLTKAEKATVMALRSGETICKG